MTDPDAVFAALADPTRRGIYRALAGGGGDTASDLARQLPISRQAVSKHLAALADAGLVSARREGRQTRYRPTLEPLEDVAAWMADVGALWDARLAALARMVERGRPDD
jgi:ArsR family transcriptional regulator, cadmium/lead-responsive transcriptional repressor